MNRFPKYLRPWRGDRKTVLLWLGGGLVAAALLISAAGPLAEKYLNRAPVVQRLQELVSRKLNGSISIEKIEVGVFFRPHLRIRGVRLDIGDRLHLETKNLKIFPAVIPLFWGQLQIARIEARRPAADVHLASGGVPSARGIDAAAGWADPVAALAALQARLPGLCLRIHGGSLRIMKNKTPRLRLRDIQAQADLSDGRFQLQCTGNIGNRIVLEGGLDPHRFQGQGVIRIEHFRPHLLVRTFFHPGPLPMEDAAADLTIHWQIADRNHQQAQIRGRIPLLALSHNGRTVDLQDGFLDAGIQRNGENVSVDLGKLQFADPAMTLSGNARIATASPFAGELVLNGTGVDVRSVRARIRTLGAEYRIVNEIFQILHSGWVPRGRFAVRFADIRNALDFHNMHIEGRIEQATVWIPKVDLRLKGASGDIVISEEVLRGRGLAANMDGTLARKGSLVVGLAGPVKPLKLDVHLLADLQQLPPFLKRIGPNEAFLVELGALKSFAGTADGILKIDGTLQSFGIRAEASRFHLRMEHDRLPVPLEIDTGSFLYRDSVLDFQGLTGRLNGLGFENLALLLDWTSSPAVSARATKASLPLADLYQWLETEGLLPAAGRLQSIDGRAVLKEMDVSGPLLHPEKWKFRIDAHIPDLRIQALGATPPLAARGIRLSATPEEIRIRESEIRIADTVLEASASFQTPWDGLHAMDLRLRGRIGEGVNRQVMARMNLPTTLTLKSYELQDFRLHRDTNGRIDAEAQLKIDGGPEISALVDWHPDFLEIHRCTLRDETSNARFRYKKDPQNIDFAFSGDLKRSTLDRLYSDNRILHGWIKGDFQAHISRSSPLGSNFQGHLSGENLYGNGLLPVPLSLQSFDLEAGEKSFHIHSAKILLDDMPVALEGGLNFTPRHISLEMEATAGDLVYETLAGIVKPGATSKSTAAAVPIEGIVLLTADSFSYRKFTWSPCRASILIQDGKTHIDVQEAAVCGLATPGRLTLSDNFFQLDFDLRADQQPLNPSFNCLLENPVELDGTYEFRGKITAAGRPAEALQALQGNFTFTAADGRIHRMETLSKILSLLNVTEIFAGRLPDFHTEGLPYDTARIQGRIEDGRMVFSQLVVDGPTMKLFGEGNIALGNGVMDLTMLVAPLKTVDRLVDKVPVINKILGGSLVSIPVKIRGDVKNPQVVPLGPGAIGTRLLDIMKNTTQLPFEIIRPILPTKKP